ncbi:PP2C family protein-serine/threonine phosphatase [Gracilinema caldarium]|uniref:PP2C family protein-serine/threonine phosphatase n=1 Tax=Gracilinema caldarium TaxID=215591 RepID=UPI0026F02216|nr:SpoIIE family protein phosphatase [Gracilinema caldarium]
MAERYLLLVDDEPNILKALSRELEDWADERSITIITAPHALKALEILKEKGQETLLVISDLRMPEMKGSDFLQIVKDTYPHILSILLTGFSETNEVIKAVRAGIFSYILKPWDSEYLLAEVDKAYKTIMLKQEHDQLTKKIQEELRWAGEMQKALLRPALPQSTSVEYRVSYRPVSHLYCGGDYYDVITLAPDRYLILIGDVAGHGVRAAFVTGILKAIIYPEYVRVNLTKKITPASFLSWLNDRMNFELRRTTGLLITFFAGILDSKSQNFTYANAGQCHPCILRGNAISELPISGSAIGFASNIMYAEQGVQLQSGDVITLYTDGLIEFTENDKPVKLAPREVFSGIPYSPEYHRQLLTCALELSRAKDFSDDVSILSAQLF